MNRDELLLARKLFQLKIYESDGQSYENLFVRVMQYANKNFEPVKPQGQIGDKKNDGFDKVCGSYYQVYAPEIIKENKANKKLSEDFKGLFKFWEGIAPIKSFHYVLNDKYKGATPTIHDELAKIEKEHTGIKCDTFLNKDLEEVFCSLSETEMLSIIGSIPSPGNISIIDYNTLNEVIAHLVKNKFKYTTTKIPKNPDFDSKIMFNNLSDYNAELLRFGSINRFAIDEYFNLNNKFIKVDLQEIFKQFYVEGLAKFKNEFNITDLIFLYIMKKSCPFDSRKHQDAAILLMSYYFEYCDIFETPPPKVKTIKKVKTK